MGSTVLAISFIYMVWLLVAKIYIQITASKEKVGKKWFFVKYILCNSLVHLLLVFLFTTIAKATFTALAWGAYVGTDKQRGTSMHFLLSIVMLVCYLIIPYLVIFVNVA